MSVARSIRSMTPEEIQAKRDWGTVACQAKGCTTRSAFLVMEGDDWWLYCCPQQYAERHGIAMPPQAPAALRRLTAH